MLKLGIIGVGKLGLPYALCFGAAGVAVKANSYKQEYIDDLSQGRYRSTEPGVNDLYQNAGNVQYTANNHDVIEHADLIYVMVATPSLSDGTYDVSAIWDVIQDFKTYDGSLVDKIMIIGSTVNPGDCADFQGSLEDLGVQVAYCPTFVAQGSVIRDIRDPLTLSIGTSNQDVFERCRDLFAKIIEKDTPIFRFHTTSAEILKMAGNCRATMLIVFFNLIGSLLYASGMQQDLDTANQYLNFVKQDARWQFGFGYGGPCYPRDNRALVEYSKKIGMPYVLGPVVDAANTKHLDFLEQHFQNLNTEKLPYYFDYVSYKPGVALFEESQQLALTERLLQQGHRVCIRPDTFLPPDVMYDLEHRYPEQVIFATRKQLDDANTRFFEVDL